MPTLCTDPDRDYAPAPEEPRPVWPPEAPDLPPIVFPIPDPYAPNEAVSE